MSLIVESMVVGGRMPRIVSDKEATTLKHWRFDNDVLTDIEEISERTGRSETDVVHLLLRWAIQQERANISAAESESAKKKTSKG